MSKFLRSLFAEDYYLSSTTLLFPLHLASILCSERGAIIPFSLLA